jgi:hypothetical protein
MVIDSVAGALTMDVASEGNIIRRGTEVVVREVVDNFRNLSVEVVSTCSTVRLPFYGTFIKQLVADKETV